MESFKISKAAPQIIDSLLFILVSISFYCREYPIISGLIIAVPCSFMVLSVIRQSIDCWKQKSVYNFTMLVSAVNLKMDYASRLVRDVIIYGLHIYLFTLNNNYFYLVSFGLCMVFDLLVYNAAFNPMMKRYVLNTAMRQVEEAQHQKAEQL